jgi:pyridoxamine 5'-phosphate oxidase
MDLGQLRRDFESAGLDRESLLEDPFEQFERWFLEARNSGIEDVNAMILATVDAEGFPGARTVLLKSFDSRGFVFYTNYRSRKARDMEENPRATLLVPWLALNRQVTVEGRVEKVSRDESFAYFSSRPRGSQLGAWVSQQSSVLDSRETLELRLQELEQRYAGREIPLPESWGGYRVRPRRLEFWQGRSSRLHDRFEYRDGPGGWQIQRLQP